MPEPLKATMFLLTLPPWLSDTPAVVPVGAVDGLLSSRVPIPEAGVNVPKV